MQVLPRSDAGSSGRAERPAYSAHHTPGAPPASDAALKKDFFVSYTSADKTWAEWIAWQLEAAGYSVVIQAWDFRPGENFVVEMQTAAAEAERTLLVLSDDYLKSSFGRSEWAAAFAQDPTGASRRVVPVRVKPCEPDGLLRAIIFVDLVGLSDEDARRRLLEGVDHDRAKPETAPE